jgi:hypothetical protein
LNQKARNLPIEWRTLGYINDLSLLQLSTEDKNLTKELKDERLHALFKTILARLIEAQELGALDDIPLLFGDETKIVNLKVPVIFIIGDMQGGDKICCTTCHYSNKLHRICQKCNVRGDESGDPLVKCKKINMLRMMQLVKDNRQDILDDFNQYNVHNAWFDVSYGGCRFGIFSAACPIEPLHSVENGIIPDCLSILFKDEMRPALKADLDSLVRQLTWLPRQRFASSLWYRTVYASLALEGWCYIPDRSFRKNEGRHHVHNYCCVTTGRRYQVFNPYVGFTATT